MRSRSLLTFSLAGVLVAGALTPATAASWSDCNKLRTAYLEKKREADELERTIRQAAERRADPSSVQEIATAFSEAREVLESADIEDAKEKIDELRENLELEKGKLKQFLDGVSDGLGKSKDLVDKATKGIKAIEDAISVLDANPEDPAAAAAGFANYVGLINEYLGPLIEKVPGLGSFMEFYTKALDAIAGAIGKIQEDLRNRSVELLGEDIYDPRWVDLRRLRREQGALAGQLRRDCGEHFRFWDGRWISVEAYDEIQAERAAAEQARLAARRETQRVNQVKSKCQGMLTDLEYTRDKIANIARQLQRLGQQADPNATPAQARRRAEEAERLARRSNELSGEYDDKKRALERECGDDAPEIANQAYVVQAEVRDAWRTGSAGAQRAYKASEIATAKQEIRDCRDRCRECHAELKRMEEDVEATQRDLEAHRGQVEAKRGEIQDLTDAYQDTREKAKTHVYESSTGALVLSATGGPQPTLAYKGWVIGGEDQKAVREAKAAQERAEQELTDLEQQVRDLERDLQRKREALQRKREECEACRKECEAKLEELTTGGLGDWLGRLRDDGTIQAQGQEFTRQARDAERGAEVAEGRADRALAAGAGAGPVAVIPAIAGAPGFSAAFAAGKSAGILGAAASRLGPFAGAWIAGPGGVFVADPATLKAMASGAQPPPRQNLVSPPQALRTGPAQPGPTRPTGPVARAPEGPAGTPPNQGGTGGGLLVPGGGPLGFQAGRGGGNGGTEGLTTGAGSQGFGTSGPSGAPPRRPATGGAPTSGGIAAGNAAASPAGVRDATRWDAVKEAIRAFLSAYVAGDLQGVLRAFSRDAWQDMTVLRNAIQEDFQNETNFNVDVELLSYYMTFDTVQVKVRVNRNSTSQTSGVVTVQSGDATLFFSRHDGFRLVAWYGFSPFGLADAAWRDQAKAGDANANVGHSSSTTSSGGGGGTFTPQLMTAGPFLLDDPFSSPSPTADHGFANFDTGATGTFDQNNTCFSTCSQPGYDIVFYGNVPTPGSVNLTVLQGQVSGGSPPNPTIDTCGGGLSLESYGPVGTMGGSSLSSSGSSPQVIVLGVQTTGGQYALVEVKGTAVGSQVQFEVRWYKGATGSQVGPGTSSCEAS